MPPLAPDPGIGAAALPTEAAFAHGVMPPLPACTTELPVCVSQLASCPCVSPTAPMPHAASAAVHVHALHALPCSVSPSASPTQEFANMQKLAFAACDCEFVDCEFVEPATPACELEFVPEFIVSQAAPAEGVGAWADAEDSTTAQNISGSSSNDAEKDDDPVARESVDDPVDEKSVGPCVLDQPAKRANMTREEKTAHNRQNRAKKQHAKAAIRAHAAATAIQALVRGAYVRDALDVFRTHWMCDREWTLENFGCNPQFLHFAHLFKPRAENATQRAATIAWNRSIGVDRTWLRDD